MDMRLTCDDGYTFTGKINNNTVKLYEWINASLLYKHIHYMKLHPEAFKDQKIEVIEPITIDIDNNDVQ
jgi:hypothetical protein